jgi:hypothetical protein
MQNAQPPISPSTRNDPPHYPAVWPPAPTPIGAALGQGDNRRALQSPGGAWGAHPSTHRTRTPAGGGADGARTRQRSGRPARVALVRPRPDHKPVTSSPVLTGPTCRLPHRASTSGLRAWRPMSPSTTGRHSLNPRSCPQSYCTDVARGSGTRQEVAGQRHQGSFSS